MTENRQIAERTMDSVLSEYTMDKLDHLAPFARALAVAKGLRQCLEMIEPHMNDLCELAGTKLGFLTDKQYDRNTIKMVLAEGMLRGALPTGNEINIIGGNLYLTKEYFQRRLGQLDGLTNLRVVQGIPQILREPHWEKVGDKNKSIPGAALVEISATWLLNGKPQSLECVKGERDTRIPIRIDPYYSIDQVLGKAESKLLRRVYKRVMGSEWVDEDEDDKVEAPTEPPRVESDSLEDFARVVRAKFARCDTVEKLGAEAKALFAANKDDTERFNVVTREAVEREDELLGHNQ